MRRLIWLAGVLALVAILGCEDATGPMPCPCPDETVGQSDGDTCDCSPPPPYEGR